MRQKTSTLWMMALAFMLIISSSMAQDEEGTTLRLPSSLKVIEEEAFYGATSIDKVVVTEGIAEIGVRAFANSTLSEISLPDSLTFIDGTAFDGVESITVLANKGSYAYEWAVEHDYIDENPLSAVVYPDEFYPSSITLENWTTEVFGGKAPYTFEYTIFIDDIAEYHSGVLDKNIYSLVIDKNEGTCYAEFTVADARQRSITSRSADIYLGQNKGPFEFTLSKGELPYATINHYGYSTGTAQHTVYIPEKYLGYTITGIDERAFTNASSIECVIIADGITKIGNEAFKTSRNLKSISFASETVYIGNKAFSECTSLDDFSIPSTVKYIGDSAFYMCNETKVVIPSTVEYLGKCAFLGNSRLCDLTIEDGLKSIEEYAFNGTAITELHLPSSIEKICNKAFANTNLSKIYISGNVTEIASDAFSNCPDTLTIYGEAGSYAETYAEEQGYAFEAIVPARKISINRSSIAMEPAASTVSVNVRATVAWSYATDCDWITLEAEENADFSSGVLKITASENAGDMRFGSVTVSSDVCSLTISVAQKGMGVNKLANPAITDPASDGDTVPYGDINVVWNAVEHAGWYVISLRDLTTDTLLIHHGTNAITGENTALLAAEYLFPGRDYRIAVGAVPAGVESTDSAVGWSERVIHVDSVQEEETASLFGQVMGNTVVSDSAEGEEGSVEEHVESSPLENAMVVLVRKTDEDSAIERVVRTDENGQWRIDGCEIGVEYRIYAMTGDDRDDVTAVDELDEADLQMSVLALPGDNDVGVQTVNLTDSDEVVRVATNYMAGTEIIEGQRSGLFAEFFQGKKNEKSASSKRWEESVPTIDFSWADATGVKIGGGLFSNWTDADSNDYNYLEVSQFSGTKLGNGAKVRYMKKDNMHVLFTGWLVMPETAEYSFRVTGDDGVRITIHKPDGKKWNADDGWLVGGRNQMAELKKVSLTKGAYYKMSIEYYNDSGDANIKFEWKKSSEAKDAYAIVPKEYMCHVPSIHRQVSVYNVNMETAAQMATLDESIDKTANNMILDMATGVVNDYVIGPAFDLSSSAYQSLGDKLVETAVSKCVRSVCEQGVKVIIGKALDPKMTNYEIHETLLEGLPEFLKEEGYVEKKISEGIEAIKKDWFVTTGDATVDIVEFLRLLHRNFPAAYEKIKSQIQEGGTVDKCYSIISYEFTEETDFETAAKSLMKDYKGVKGYIDYVRDCLEAVKKYKDPNRVRSYLHLMYIENPNKAMDYVDLIRVGRAYRMIAGDWTRNYVEHNYVSALDECSNSALIEYIDTMAGNKSNQLILLYKQILNGALKLAVQQCRIKL